MGLNPIEYRPWKGLRSEHGRRPLVIASKVFQQKLRSKWFVALLILGSILAHGLYLIFTSIMPHASLTPQAMAGQMQSGLFYVFTIILVAVACSDLVAEDLRSNSLVLYLSRALRTDGYLLGKALGVAMAIAIFTLLLPVVVAIAVTATQNGSDYTSSAAVVGQTVLAGLWTTVFLIPLAVLMSTLTTRKTYAAVGAFVLFFVLGIIADFLSRFDANWALLSPQALLFHAYEGIYGLKLSAGADAASQILVSAAFVVLPTLLAYYLIHRREVGV
jgi:ABC-type transport system involved in multi-copper enzyme maturation permease subunit